MEGIVTLDDIIEEIVGEIQDGYSVKVDEWFCQVEEKVFIINGRASIKDVNQRLPFKLPERKEYTTLAGFFLYQFGKIPQEGELMSYKGHKFIVEKMNKRHISLLRVIL
jgi:putative hemolysin